MLLRKQNIEKTDIIVYNSINYEPGVMGSRNRFV